MKKFSILFLTILVMAGLTPFVATAKHACQMDLPFESCSHEKAVCTNIVSNQRIGNKNSAVTLLQDYLALYGYLAVSPTGYFGVKTQEALKAFQKAHNIEATGFLGPLTRAQLKGNSCATVSPATTTTTTTTTITPTPTVIPANTLQQSTSAWNSWTATKLAPISDATLNTLKQVLGSIGISTNFATTTLTEKEIIDITKKFELEYILN